MKHNMPDIYTDFLIASFDAATATNLSRLTNGAISHDKVSRFLRDNKFTSQDLWLKAKSFVRQVESKSDGVLIIDDSIEEKPYTDENDIICWHWDHSKGRSVKGINFITALYNSSNVSIPVCFSLVEKIEEYIDPKTDRKKRRSKVTKNEHFLSLLNQCDKNQLEYTYILADIWYASSKNMTYIKKELKKEFIMPLKKNRKIALSKTDKLEGSWKKLEDIELNENTCKEVYLEGLDFPVSLSKCVFKNDDDSIGILYLLSSDLSLNFTDKAAIYKKRWKVEEYHKSVKNNASLEKSPTKTKRTQTNHFFASLCAFIKLEKLKAAKATNHYAFKLKLYTEALKHSFELLNKLKQEVPDYAIPN